MRELIKSGAYHFDDKSRSITITDGRSFTAHDIRLIYNETQDVVLVSSGAKAGITVSGSIITYPDSIPALVAGDDITIEIDFPQKEVLVVTHTQPVNFTNLSATVNIQQTGTMLSFGNATNLQILRIGATSYVSLSLPAFVNQGESINATVQNTGIQNIIIQKSSTSSNTISTGSLVAKTLDSGCTFAYYSTYLSKVLVGGLAVFDEDKNYINGDGNTGFYPSIGQAFFNTHHLEYNGKLYYYSMERSWIIELDLSNGSIRGILGGVFPFQMIIVGNNIYINSYGSGGYAIRVVDLTTLAITNFGYTSNSSTFIPMFSDGVSIYYANYTGNIVWKLTGTTLVSSSGGGTTNYYPFTIAVGDYVYMNNSNQIYKYNKSDMTWVATLAAGVLGGVNTLIANTDGSYIYCLGATGTIQKISTSSFTITATFSSGISDLKFASVILYNGKIYIMSGDGRGSDIGQTFAVLDTSNDVVTLYAPPTNGLNFNTHNALNIDPVNNRLIFFGVNTLGISFYNVEIINIP